MSIARNRFYQLGQMPNVPYPQYQQYQQYQPNLPYQQQYQPYQSGFNKQDQTKQLMMLALGGAVLYMLLGKGKKEEAGVWVPAVEKTTRTISYPGKKEQYELVDGKWELVSEK
jgi:hypothetical protein